MKTIEQLLQLTKNPYYVLSKEEQALLDDFLSKQSGRGKQVNPSSKNLEYNTPAIVHAKNVVSTEKGVVPTDEQLAASQKQIVS